MLDTNALWWLERRMKAEEMIGAAVDFICGKRPTPIPFPEYARGKTRGVLWLAAHQPHKHTSRRELEAKLKPVRERQRAHRFLMRLINEDRARSGLPAFRF